MSSPRLVATCWTSAGDVRPLDVPERSPYPASERVRAVADGGWAGIGFAQGDLEVVRDTTGFAELAVAIRDAGLDHVEVELATDWWLEPGRWRPRVDLLFAAADALGANVVKVGTAFSSPLTDLTPLVDPLRRLAIEAGRHDVRLALEPLPFSMVGSLPAGAELVHQVDHPSCGLTVDAWHVFRAGTSLAQLRECLRPGDVVCVELDDADARPVGTLFEDTRDRRRYCGEGDFDLAGFVDVVRGTGFDGPWGVEILSQEHRALPLVEGLRRAFDSTTRLLTHA
ncbi:MAG: sugar phosphate isomerase/epimerase family protein [Janthinobacterium lividum]